jgi:hypothetical protein
MRQVTRKGLMTVAAATGVIAAAGGAAHADSAANGSAYNSPGVLSGNTVQAPVDVPVNVCGNTVNVVGLLNPATGNSCANQGGGNGHSGGGGASADGHASDSPGVLSGNTVQAPVHVPVNVCGNTVNVVGVGNSAEGNDCANQGGNGGGDGGASGDGYTSDSPGVLSGNAVQAPVHVPVNVCGNTVNVVGVGNSAEGNDCANQGGNGGGDGGASSGGHASDSPGVGSGNHIEVPIHVPVNACGNSVDIIAVGNSTTGNDCVNGSGGNETPPPGTPSPEEPGNPGNPGNPGSPEQPGSPTTPPAPGGETPGGSSHGNQLGGHAEGSGQLAHTGSDLPIGMVLPVGAGALLAGAVLYRKARASA